MISWFFWCFKVLELLEFWLVEVEGVFGLVFCNRLISIGFRFKGGILFLMIVLNFMSLIWFLSFWGRIRKG